MIANLKSEPVCKIKWQDELEITINDLQWKQVFTMPAKITIDSSIRIFKYKIVHRILPCNKLLNLYKIKEYDKCDRCPTEIETLQHMFHICPAICAI